MREVRERVLQALRDYPEYRDDDNKLMAHIWLDDAAAKGLNYYDFLSDFIKGKYSNSESIRRSRQMLNKAYPETRGLSYEKRQKKGREVRESITTEQFLENIKSRYKEFPWEKEDMDLLSLSVYFAPNDGMPEYLGHMTIGKKYKVKAILREDKRIGVINDNNTFIHLPSFYLKVR